MLVGASAVIALRVLQVGANIPLARLGVLYESSGPALPLISPAVLCCS